MGGVGIVSSSKSKSIALPHCSNRESCSGPQCNGILEHCPGLPYERWRGKYTIAFAMFSLHINFFGIALWNDFHLTVLHKIQAAYVKCVKMFFGFERRDSASNMFLELELPTFETIILNAKTKFMRNLHQHTNSRVEPCVALF